MSPNHPTNCQALLRTAAKKAMKRCDFVESATIFLHHTLRRPPAVDY